jgi:hypothetical protein
VALTACSRAGTSAPARGGSSELEARASEETGELLAHEERAPAIARSQAEVAGEDERASELEQERELEPLLADHPEKFGHLIDDPARWRLQILVTVITPASEGATQLRYGYRVDAEYVYPASAIKTFASVAALHRLAALRVEDDALDLDTPMALCARGARRCVKVRDPSNLAGGTITLGHEIRKMQLVSNNEAFNRLYNFVGQRELNETLWAMGFPELRVHHRMYDNPDPATWRVTPRSELRPRGREPVVIDARESELVMPPSPVTGLQFGQAYIDRAGARVEGPMDFSTKNWVSLRAFHRLALSIARPELPGAVSLGIEPEHRAFLVRAMTEDPLASSNPVYRDPKKSGLRYKTMIRGMMRVMPLERIRYAGKAGRAFGFHLDNAYIEDRASGRAMVVTVAIYANGNGVLNDNRYGYDAITRPFLKNLGEVLADAALLHPERLPD